MSDWIVKLLGYEANDLLEHRWLGDKVTLEFDLHSSTARETLARYKEAFPEATLEILPADSPLEKPVERNRLR